MVSFPPHCSHKMQPLDVSIYGPVKGYYRTAVKDWQIANAGKAVEIRHIPGLACKALDQALTPANIKAGFTATGICPLNRNIFTPSDFVQAAQSDEQQMASLIERSSDKEDQRSICVLTDQTDITTHAEVYTSEPSTSAAASDVSRSESFSSLLSDIGPFQQATPHKKSNRGRKPMKSAVLTSPEFVADLKDKKQKRDAAKKKKEENAKKRTQAALMKPPQAKKRAAKKKSSSSSDPEDVDFCMICMKNLPAKLTKNNSIECDVCQRPFHLKCVQMSRSYFTCQNCNSDADLSDEN